MPISNLEVRVETQQQLTRANEEDCIVCDFETVAGQESYEYDACTKECRIVAEIANVCRYIDGTLQSTEESHNREDSVAQSLCCQQGLETSDANLLEACDERDNLPLRCIPITRERTDTRLTVDGEGSCWQEFKIEEVRHFMGMRILESMENGIEEVPRDICCEEFIGGDDALRKGCFIADLGTQEETFFNQENRICLNLVTQKAEIKLPSTLEFLQEESLTTETEISLDECCHQFLAGDETMRSACDIKEQQPLTTLMYDPDMNTCKTVTETQTTFSFADMMTVADTQIERLFTDESLDECCLSFAEDGDTTMQAACKVIQGPAQVQFVWSSTASSDGTCIQTTTIQILYILPEADRAVKLDEQETVQIANEDDCIVCADEETNVSYSFDECSSFCYKMATIGEVCRYTDETGTVRSTGPTEEETQVVDSDICCTNSSTDSSLLLACVSTDFLTCPGTPFTRRTDGDLVLQNGQCLQQYTVTTLREVNGVEQVESEQSEQEEVDPDQCCIEFGNGVDALEQACEIDVMVIPPDELIYDTENLCRIRQQQQTIYSLPNAMTTVRISDAEIFIPQSVDTCCQRFAEGDNSLRAACMLDIADVVSSRLVYDPVSNSCRTRTITRIDFTLPEAMRVVRQTNVESFTEQSVDQCCLAFFNDGKEDFEAACETRVTVLKSKLEYDQEQQLCQTVTMSIVQLFLPESMTALTTDLQDTTEPESLDTCCLAFLQDGSHFENACTTVDTEISFEIIFDGVNMCQTRSVIQRNYLFPGTGEVASTETIEQSLDVSDDICCQGFVDGLQPVGEACTIQEQTIADEYQWNNKIGMCMRQIVIQTIYSLPVAGTTVDIQNRDVVAMAEEAECIVCSDEVLGTTEYTYDVCELVCTKTESIGEVCRYTDDEGTVSSVQEVEETTDQVDRSECCSNARGSVNLLNACSLDTTKPLQCFESFDVQTVDEITYTDGECVQIVTTRTFKTVDGVDMLVGEVQSQENAGLDPCCAAFAEGDESMREACTVVSEIVTTGLFLGDLGTCFKWEVMKLTFSLPKAMTIVKEEETEEFTKRSVDECCQAHVDGDDFLRDACTFRITELSPELTYDEPQMCRSKIVTRTETVLPESMVVVDVQLSESFTDTDLDSCCLSFSNGDEALKDACFQSTQDISFDIQYDSSSKTCLMVTDQLVQFRLPSDQMTVVKTDMVKETARASPDQCCKLFVAGNLMMRDACDKDQIVSTDFTYDPTNLCRVRTVTRTFYIFPEAMTRATTQTMETYEASDLDSCCQGFADGGDDSLGQACTVVEGDQTDSFVWDGSRCNLNTATETTYLLPNANTVATVLYPATISFARIENCLICRSVMVGNPVYSYDLCRSRCSAVAIQQEICSFNDEQGTEAYRTPLSTVTSTVTQQECCLSADGDASLEAACDLSGNKPESCCATEIQEWNSLTVQVETMIDSDLLDAYIDELVYLSGQIDGDAYRTVLISFVCPLDSDTETGFVDAPSLEDACDESTEQAIINFSNARSMLAQQLCVQNTLTDLCTSIADEWAQQLVDINQTTGQISLDVSELCGMKRANFLISGAEDQLPTCSIETIRIQFMEDTENIPLEQTKFVRSPPDRTVPADSCPMREDFMASRINLDRGIRTYENILSLSEWITTQITEECETYNNHLRDVQTPQLIDLLNNFSYARTEQVLVPLLEDISSTEDLITMYQELTESGMREAFESEYTVDDAYKSFCPYDPDHYSGYEQAVDAYNQEAGVYSFQEELADQECLSYQQTLAEEQMEAEENRD